MPAATAAKPAVAEKNATDRAAEKFGRMKDAGELAGKYDDACMQSSQRYDSKKCAPVKAVRNTVNAPRKADRR